MSFDTTTGRWLQQDPDVYIDGPNVYQFEKSNPVDSEDPTGTTDITITVQRENYNTQSTTGTITVGTADDPNGVTGYTVEPPKVALPKPDGNGTKTMPPGTYKATWNPSKNGKKITGKHKGEVLLLDVPGHTGVEIHPGNTWKDSTGCICPGKAADGDGVDQSVAEVQAITDYISKIEAQDKANGEKTTITVILKNPPAATQPATPAPQK